MGEARASMGSLRRRAVLVGPMMLGRAGGVARPWARLITERLTLRAGDLVVGVDAGVLACRKLGLQPELAVGDWDSLSRRTGAVSRALRGVPHVTLARQKDRSDFFHAATEALRRTCRRLVCVGFTGGRPDHAQAVLLDLAAIAAAGRAESVLLLGPEADYHFVSRETGEWRADDHGYPPGATVSVLPLLGPAQGVTLRGFAYPLRSAALEPGSRGLSNVLRSRSATVRVGRGAVAVIVPAGGRE